ncbi:unnamed protein product, partial [Prorocentrum cordatum]
CAWKRPPRLLRQREAANGRGARARSSWAARELPAATPQGPTPRGPIDRDPLFEPADASARGRPWQAPWRRAAGLEGLSSAHEAARELGEPPRRAARRSPLEAGGGGGPRRGPSELGRAGRGGQAGAR